MMKRILALCMTLLCLINMVPFSAFAAEDGTTAAAVETVQPVETDLVEPQADSGVAVVDDTVLASGTCGDSVTWSLSADYVLTISGTGAMANYTSSTGMPWAAYLNNITKVVVEQGVTTIGNYAFYGCKMTNVSLPEGITSLGTMSFVYCSNLRYVVIPSTVKTVNANALSGLSGARLILFQGNAPSIPTYAFSYFYGTICYPSGNSTWTSSVLSKGDNDGIWAAVEDQGTSGDVQWLRTNKNQVIVFGEGAMANYTSSNEAPWEESVQSITTAELIKGVTTVGNRAFIGCKNLSNVILPTGVTSIGNYAFDDCLGLTKITIPEGVTSIGSYAFYNCTNLVSISLPSTLTAINNYAFYKCYKLPRIKLPEGLLTIGNYAFEYCSAINSITMPSSVTYLGSLVFGYCGDLRIIFAGNAPDVGANIFYGCDAVNCWYTATATGFDSIGTSKYGADYCAWFSGKSGSCGDDVYYIYCASNGQMLIYGEGPMTDYQSSSGMPWYSYRDEIYLVYVDYGVTSVGDYAFPFCYYLYHVGLAETVTKIGYYSFRSCKELASINFPDAITEIDHYAFQYCYALTSIDLPASLRTIGNTAFGSCTGLTKLEIPANVTNIYNDAFENCTAVTEIVFRGNAPSFGSTVFAGITATAVYPTGNTTWTADKTVDHGGTLTWSDGYRGSVGENVTWHFDHVSGTLTISGTGEMYEYTGNVDVPWYSYLDQIKEVMIEEGVTNTCFCAFAYSDTLEKVTLPSTLTELGSSTFSSCVKLTEITLPDNLKKIGAHAFDSCTGLTEIIIPDTVTDIGMQAFYSCNGIKEIVIPASVSDISSSAFANAGFNKITFLGDPPSVGSSIFGYLTATVYYPVPNAAWESSNLIKYQQGGTAITWDSYPTETFSGTVADGLTWTLTPGGVLTISGEGAMPDYTSEASTPWYKAGFHTNYHSVVIESGVTYVGRYAFSKSNVETAYIAASAMGSDAFYECPLLTEVEIADGMTTMGSTNFYGCEALTNVTLPGSITAIGTYNFYDCPGITSLGPTGSGASIEYGWTEHVPDNAFYECLYVTEISFPSTLKSIGKDSFAYCKAVTRLELPEGLEIIGYRSFNTGHGLEEVIIPASVTYIDGWAFQDNHANIYFQGSAPEMHQYAFVNGRSTLHYHGADCSWIGVQDELSISLGTWVNMDDTTASHTPGEVVIENETAADCVTAEAHDEVTYCTVCGKQASRTNVVTAEAWGHTEVVDAAVDATCTEDGLTEGSHCEVCGEVLVAQEVIAAAGHSYEDSTCTVCGDCLYTDRGTCGDSLNWCFWKDGTLTVSGEGAMTTYSAVANTPWYSYLGSVLAITVEEGVTTISKNAFRDATAMTSLSLPTTLADIGTSAFRGCTALTAVEIPAGTTVGTYAFYKCSALESAIVPSVENIGVNAFGYCPKLTTAGPIGGDYNIQFGISSTTLEANPFTWCSTVTSIVLPEGIEAVGNNAFQDCISLKHISLPESMTSIGVAAFSGCTGLQSIMIPDGVSSISARVFQDCTALVSVTLPDTIAVIGDSAFSGCAALSNVVLPAALATIEQYAFEACTALTELTIPASVTAIGDNAFAGCTNLAEMYVASVDAAIGSATFAENTYLFCYQDSTAAAYAAENGNAYCAAEAGSDLGHSYEAVVTDPTCEEMGYTTHACAWCSDNYVDTYTEAVGHSFTDYVSNGDATCTADGTKTAQCDNGCGATDTVADEGTVLAHGYEATVTPPTCVQEGYTTYTCVVCGDSYTDNYTPVIDHTVEHGTCTSCGTVFGLDSGTCGESLSWLLSEEGVLIISGTGAMTAFSSASEAPWYTHQSSITAVELCNGVTTVSAYAFRDATALTSVLLSSTVTDIGASAFRGCSALTSVNLPEGAAVGSYAFYKCSALESVMIPDITRIGSNAFNQCPKLVSAGPVGGDYNICFGTSDSVMRSGAFAWCGTITDIVLPEGIETLGYDAFRDWSTLKSVVLPDSLTSIGTNAFQGCSGITELVLPAGIDEIMDNTFTDCTSLRTVNIPNGVTRIGYAAFWNCTALTGVVIPDSVEELGTDAFAMCSSITEIVIPDSIMEIPASCFLYCRSLERVVIADTVGVIGSSAFLCCYKLQNVVIPDSVMVIEANAFSECFALTEVLIPDSVEIIGNSAFYDCRGLTKVIIPETVMEIGSNCFQSCVGVDFYIYAMDTDFGENAIEQTDNFVYCYEGSAAEAYTEGYARCVAPVGEDLGHIYDEVVTEPTCTENGCTAHTCGRCGDSYVTDVIEAVGHSWDAGVVTKEPTDEENGEILYTCNVCGETMATEIPNNHVDFVGMSLSLNGDIGINFYVTLSADILADENARMVFNVGGKAQEMWLGNAPISPDEDGTIRYRFSCCVPAKGMADEIVAQMYKGDNAVGESKTYSVAAYYDDICAQFNREEKAELFALIESMLNYGAAAQEYFGYNTETPANASVAVSIPQTVDASSYANVVCNTEQDIFYAGASLVLETNTTLRVFFRLVAGTDIGDYTFTVDGMEVTPVQRGNLWYVELTDIAAKNLDDAHTFTAGEVTVICSALSYVNNVLNKADSMDVALVTLCKALYAYNAAANVYFSK